MFLRQMWCRNNFFDYPSLPQVRVNKVTWTSSRSSRTSWVTVPDYAKDRLPKKCHNQCKKKHPDCKEPEPPKDETTCDYYCDRGSTCMVFKIHTAFDSIIINVLTCRNNNFFIIRHCLRCVTRRWPGPLPDLHVHVIQVRELTPTIGRTSYRRNVTTSARSITQIVLGSKTNQKTPISSNWEPNCLPLTFALT